MVALDYPEFHYLLALELGEGETFDAHPTPADVGLVPSKREAYRTAGTAITYLNRHNGAGVKLALRTTAANTFTIYCIERDGQKADPPAGRFCTRRRRLKRPPPTPSPVETSPLQRHLLVSMVREHASGATIQRLVGDQWIDDPAPTFDGPLRAWRVKPELREFWIVERVNGAASVLPQKPAGVESIHVREVLEVPA